MEWRPRLPSFPLPAQNQRCQISNRNESKTSKRKRVDVYAPRAPLDIFLTDRTSSFLLFSYSFRGTRKRRCYLRPYFARGYTQLPLRTVILACFPSFNFQRTAATPRERFLRSATMQVGARVFTLRVYPKAVSAILYGELCIYRKYIMHVAWHGVGTRATALSIRSLFFRADLGQLKWCKKQKEKKKK